MTEETLGARLYRLRTERGWSQATAGKKLGVGHNQIWSWECERRRPKIDSLEKIAAVYGVPLSYLVPDKTESIPQDDGETLGERIKRLRLRKAWTRSGLGSAISVSHQMIYDWETGKYNPRADDIKPLATALGVTTDYLLDGRESPLLAAIKAQIKQNAPYDRLLAMVTNI